MASIRRSRSDFSSCFPGATGQASRPGQTSAAGTPTGAVTPGATPKWEGATKAGERPGASAHPVAPVPPNAVDADGAEAWVGPDPELGRKLGVHPDSNPGPTICP